MSYGCVYLHTNYIVMDPPICGVYLGSFASQKFVLSRDTTCASKKPLNLVSCHEFPPYLPMD